MFFWKRNKNWEDEYDDYYTRDIERGDGKVRLRFVPHLLLLFFIGVVFCVIVSYVSSVQMMEKLLTSLLMPVGILWLALLVTIYFCLLVRSSWPATMCFLCWILLTVSGNQYFTHWYARTIESEYLDQNLDEMEPFDVVVVLGGGTGTRVSGAPQVREYGDRVVQAAQLWHAGQARQVMCTGHQFSRTEEKDLHPHEEAKILLEGLGVDSQAIVQLSGSNTLEEMQNLKKWSEANPGKRIGLLTSAWHLPRAVRLAKAEGIEVHGLAAGFFSQPWAPGPDVIVPNEQNLQITAAVTKEYLAKLVGR